jgi:threonine dehydratase
MAKIHIPSINNIEEAYSLIESHIHKTPLIKSELLNNKLQCSLVFKCENMQKAGAFKYRGATHAILKLNDEEKRRGVATHSSGNHAGALAKAAALQGIKAYIIMPNNAPKAKVAAVRAYGGKITFCEPTLQAREDTLEKIQQETGAVFIHPYDNFNVICGQGTSCLELTKQMDEPDIVLAPVGGGGLLSGTSIVSKNKWSNTKVIGCEPKNADDAYRSFNSHTLIPSINPKTMADGLLTSLSDRTFSIITQNVDAILTCKEQTIMEALRLVFQYLKIVIEPSSAVPLATILENPELFKNKRIAIIVSGGNVDLANLPF